MHCFRWIFKSSVLCCLIVFQPSFACTNTPLLWPEPLKTLDTSQLTLRWAAANDQPYRIQLSLQTPEQGIFYSSDVQITGGQWQLPAAVVSVFTAAKVIVSQGCNTYTAADLAASPPSFFVDLRNACRISPDSLKLTAQRLEWQGSSAATLFRLRIYQNSTNPTAPPNLIRSEDASNTNWLIPKDFCSHPNAKIITVQPICDQITGRPLAAVVCP